MLAKDRILTETTHHYINPPPTYSVVRSYLKTLWKITARQGAMRFVAAKTALRICLSVLGKNRPGGGLTLTWYTYMCLPFGVLFREIWYSDRGVFIRDEGAQIQKLGVFWANYCKKHPILPKVGAFLWKMVYWWVGNWAKNWYRESQIFEVWQAHPRTILARVTPLPRENRPINKWYFLWVLSL